MLIVRAIRKDDLDGLLALAELVGPGMTTLKPDRRALGDRVDIACASFAQQIPPAQRDYLFVMEDTGTGKVAGVSAIKAAVGLDETFYNYRIGTLVHSSKELKVFSRMDTLYLSNDLTGCAELCSLFLHPDYRAGTNGKLLSKSRFLFIAQFPHLFPEKLIAEMRGFIDANGRSPFWDSLGQHFFRMDFNRADELTSLGKKSFIAELMPRHPLYVAYLTPQAQSAIGRVHADTEPARRLLEQEGMHYEGYVDIFDAGAVLQARVAELRAAHDSKLVIADVAPGVTTTSGVDTPGGETPGVATPGVAVPGTAPGAENGVVPALVCNTALPDFRVIVAPAKPQRGRVALPTSQLQLLGRRAGEQVRTMPLKPKKGRHA